MAADNAALVVPPFLITTGVSMTSGGSASGASLTLPNSTVVPMTFDSTTNQWLTTVQVYSSQSALDAAFPSGAYAITVNANTDGTKVFNLTEGSDAFPNAPQLITGNRRF